MIVGALLIFVALASTRPLPGASENRAQRIGIGVFQPTLVNVPRQWIGFATVRALESVDVPARVGATVVELAQNAKPGAAIAAGQFLVQLDDQDFRRAVEAANQQLAALDAQLGTVLVEEEGLGKRLALAIEDAQLVRADEARTRVVVESGAASNRELDRARQMSIVAERAQLTLQEAINQIPPRRLALLAQVEVQRTARANAQASLERCRISSPIAGVLQRFPLEVGESVSPGQVVARVVNPAIVEIPIHLPASSRASVRVGDPVDYEIVGQVERRGTSTVARIEPEDDPIERTTTVYLEVAQGADAALRIAPGAFAQATVSSRDSDMRMVIPRRSTRAERVLELVGGKLVQRDVDVSHAFHGSIPGSGVTDLDWLVLREPLPAGITIALDGGRSVVPGAVFEANNEVAPSASAMEPATGSGPHE